MNFKDKLDKIIKKNNSLVCVGLDTEIEKLPNHLKKANDAIFKFNKAIIDATHDKVCVYKPNIAFYEAYGIDGLTQLKKTITYIQYKYPEVPILLDAKRGDIGNTAKMYAKAIFDYWKADATTIYPHLGMDTISPYLEYKNKLVILLIKTSNPDSGMFQDMKVGADPFYLAMAKKIKKLVLAYNNVGIFVGATYPEEMRQIRKLFPDKIFLTAGIGAQKAEAKNTIQAGLDKNKSGIMFNASRSILYASNGEDFGERAREETDKLRTEINKYR